MFYSKCSFFLGVFAYGMLFPLFAFAADEMFVSIQKAEGFTITVVQEAQQGRGGRRGGGGAGGQNPGRGRRGGAVAQPKMEYQVAQNVKVTLAMRERRTQELLVGVELSGGLRNPIFQKMQQPFSARLLFTRNQVTEINVITSGGDINQTVSSSDGVPDIAVRPKRPPMKK